MEVMRQIPTNTARHTISLDSSSSPPSSPPQSPQLSDQECSTISLQQNTLISNPALGKTPAITLTSGGNALSHAKPTTKTRAPADPNAVKKPRKRKDPNEPVDPNKPVKEKKPRKPRDPNAPPRKRQKLSTDPTTIKIAAPKATSTASVLSIGQPSSQSHGAVEYAKPLFAKLGKVDNDSTLTAPLYGSLQQQPMRPQSSGQHYDPIRSASAENARLHTSPSMLAATAIPSARASPSIASLIDPPGAYTPRQPSNLVPAPSTTSVPPPAMVFATSIQTSIAPPSRKQSTSAKDPSSAKAKPTLGKERSIKAESPPVVPSPTPKPVRQKETVPTLPLGSGLLSSSAFGGRSETANKVYAEVPNQCIVIDVPITQETGTYVNFMREVENKYGFDVAYPRAAEHRARMAEMAAAGSALEPDGEDMNVDDSGSDSNVEMGGVGGDDSTAAEGKKKRVVRKKKLDDYDTKDDFIDDTEQMWEEQAMVSNNGYFVWSGPLVPEEPKPAADKPSTGRAKGKPRGAKAATAPRGETTGRRGGGPGSRGGRAGKTDGVVRKRITKADKAKMEVEQKERENYAAAVQKSVLQAEIEV